MLVLIEFKTKQTYLTNMCDHRLHVIDDCIDKKL